METSMGRTRVALIVAMLLVLDSCEKIGSAAIFKDDPLEKMLIVEPKTVKGEQDFAAWLDVLKIKVRETRKIKPAVLKRVFVNVKPLHRVLSSTLTTASPNSR